MTDTNKRSGFIALVSVIIIMVVVIVFLASSQNVSTQGLNSTLSRRLSTEARFVAQSCYEDTLILLKSDSDYTGGELNIADGFCTISVSGAGQTKTIQITANTLNDYYVLIDAQVQLIENGETSEIQVQSFQIN